MQRTVFDLRVDASNIERQISEKELEIQVLKGKLAELNVEFTKAKEANEIAQREAAHVEIQAKLDAQKVQAEAPAQAAVPAVATPAVAAAPVA